MTWRLRGGQTVPVVLGSARLYVSAHQQKRWVVALKYPGEEDYRYLVATEMSWRAVDVASAYTLRWLVEICQPYNLRKTQVIMTPWGRAIACYGRRLALPVIVPTWRHRLGSATADALAGRPADL